MAQKVISYSALDTFFRCPRKYYFSYVARLVKKEFQLSPMTMGSCIHSGMSYGLILYHATEYELTLEELRDQLTAMFSNWRETNKPTPRMKVDAFGNVVEDLTTTTEFFEMVDTVNDIVYRTFKHLDIPNNWRTVEFNDKPIIEWRDEVEIIPPLYQAEFGNIAKQVPDSNVMFQFQCDWVAQNLNDGLTYLVDWKSRRSFQDTDHEVSISGDDFSTQMSLYQKALQLLGIHTDATMTFQISPFNPKRPEVLKNGRVSKSNIKSDWETYSQVLLEQDENPDDPYYADMKERLSDTEWFSPIVLFRPQIELDTRWQDAQLWAGQIYSEQQDFLPVENTQCVFCPYAKLCLGRDRGYDIDDMIRNEYNSKDDTNRAK
jgi:hypothetical protein